MRFQLVLAQRHNLISEYATSTEQLSTGARPNMDRMLSITSVIRIPAFAIWLRAAYASATSRSDLFNHRNPAFALVTMVAKGCFDLVPDRRSYFAHAGSPQPVSKLATGQINQGRDRVEVPPFKAHDVTRACAAVANRERTSYRTVVQYCKARRPVSLG